MLNEIFAQQRKERFAGIRGAFLQGRLPIQEHYLTPFLDQAVRDSNGKLRRLKIAIMEGNTLFVDATVSVMFFTKDIRLQLRIDPVVDFAISPLLKIHIIDSQGIPGFVLELLLGMLPFPESIQILPRMVTIDLKRALTRRKLDEFVPLLKRLGLSTRRGCAMIDFHFAVD